MKNILLVLILLPSLVIGQGAIEVTFTNQADFDAYNFQVSKGYIVKLYNDTNLPVNNQINSLQPLLAIDSVLTLDAEFTLLTSLDGLENIESLVLFLEGNKLWDTLYIPDYIEGLYGVRCERTFLKHIYGAAQVKFLNGIELLDNDRLKTVDLDLGLLDSTTTQIGSRLLVQQNDSLKSFYWNNEFQMLGSFDFFENRQLKHVHLQTVKEFVSPFLGTQGGFRFNIVLDSISGCIGLDSVFSLNLKQNYMLKNACVFQKGIKNYLESNPGHESFFAVENNAVGLQSLNDLLTADCSWLPNGVGEVTYNGLEVYPNPAHNEVFVEVPVKSTQYKIFDMSGKVIQMGFVASNGRVDLASVSSGMYVLLVNDKRTKLVVQ